MEDNHALNYFTKNNITWISNKEEFEMAEKFEKKFVE